MILTNEDIEKVIWKVVDQFLIPKFNDLDMNASGEWLGALSVKGVSSNRGEIWGKDYTYYLENGRKPNEDQSKEALHKWAKWAAATFIKQWCIDKGISLDRAFGIAYHIAKTGTDNYPQGTDLIKVLYEPECQTFIQNEMNILYRERLPSLILAKLKKLEKR